jgi:nucleoid-associated protein YgaU
VRASRFFVPLVVIVVGLCAAWPFRQEQEVRIEPPPKAAPLALPLRRPDAPLELAPRYEPSPAIGLQSPPAPFAEQPLTPVSRSIELTNVSPPPALPVSFQPAVEEKTANNWRPELLTPARPPAKSRPYRLRDGDTLEKIAERLLGNRERAAEIFEANRDVLAMPDLLPVGVTILVPPRETASNMEPVGGER